MIENAMNKRRVFLHRDPIDMRKSINGLAVLVDTEMEKNPFDAALFVFCNRNGDKIKILYWERNGFCLWYKRLEKERFQWPFVGGELVVKSISSQELAWLLEGVDITKLKRHKQLEYESVT